MLHRSITSFPPKHPYFCPNTPFPVPPALHTPANDAATTPHEGNSSVVKVPPKLSCCLPQEHEALGIGNNLAGIEGLQRDNTEGTMRGRVIKRSENNNISKNIGK